MLVMEVCALCWSWRCVRCVGHGAVLVMEVCALCWSRSCVRCVGHGAVLVMEVCAVLVMEVCALCCSRSCVLCFRTASGKSLAVSPSSKGPNLQRGTVARNTFHGKDARRQVQSPYNGPGGAPSHTVDTSAMGPGGARPSFFGRITQKFSRR